MQPLLAMTFLDRKISFFLIPLFALASTGFGEDDASDTNLEQVEAAGPMLLTVPELIERVKSQNLDLMIRSETVSRALQQSYQTRAALLPQLDISAQQTRSQSARDSGMISSNVSPEDRFSARIRGRLTLVNPQQYADFRVAKLGYSIEELDFDVAIQDVLDQAVFIYFTHLRDLVLIEIALGTLEREEQLLDLAEKQFDAGVAIKLDVTRAEVRVANAKRSVIQARTDADSSLLQLKELLDFDFDDELEFDHSIISNVVTPEKLYAIGKQVDLSEVRSEFERQNQLLEQSRLAKRAVRWQRLPQFDLFADWGYDSDRALDGDEGETWWIGVQASVPIWEGGRIAAESLEASAAVRQSEFALKQIRNAIEREYEFAGIEMKSRYDQIEFAWDEVRLGKDELSQARERYEEGLADNRELIDAQQSLADAERAHVDSVYLYGVSRIAFARSIGVVERVLD